MKLLSMNIVRPKASLEDEHGIAHVFFVLLLTLLIPLTLFAVSRQVFKRGRAQVPITAPCPTPQSCPSPTPGGRTARLYLKPTQQLLPRSQEIPVEIHANSNFHDPSHNWSMNAVQANVTFDPTQLTVVRTDFTNTAFQLEAENTVGTNVVRIGRATTTPIVGDALVGVIVFKPTATGLLETSPAIDVTTSEIDSDITHADIMQSAGSATYNITRDLLGDFNGDNIVNIRDLSFLASAWQKHDPLTDIFYDGITDIKDLSVFASNWNKTAP